MKLIDTHTHLYSDAFAEDREEMVNRAIKKGVGRFFLPAIDSETTQAMYNLETQFPKEMHLMMGLHPTSVKENYKEELQHVKNQFIERDFCAVGEIRMIVLG